MNPDYRSERAEVFGKIGLSKYQKAQAAAAEVREKLRQELEKALTR